MAGPSGLVIKVAANLEELRKNLADGTGMITTTTAAMNKLASSLDGNKLFQNANNIVAAVDKIGGASKLTEAEQARLNTTLQKAIEKYQAMGQAAPKAMVDLEQATHKTAASTEGWGASLGKVNGLLLTFGVGLSVGAVVGFGKELLRMGDEIVRVKDRTGLTIKEVQQFTYIAGQSGNTIDELTSAIGQMQNRLVSGDKSAVAAVKDLGINFGALMAASPANQMEMIATAIAKIPDPAHRTAVAMDLFGKTGTAILPTLTSQFGDLARAAPVMSDATVKALDAAGDATGRLWLAIKVLAAEGIVKLVESTSALERFAWWFAGMKKPLGAFNVETASMSVAMDRVTYSTGKTTEELKAAAAAVTAHAKLMELDRKALDAMKQELFDAEVTQSKWTASVENASVKVRVLVTNLGAAPPAIASMNASMGAYDLIVEHGTAALLRHAEAAKKAEAELQRLGMSMPNLAIQSQNVSAEVTKTGGALTALKGVATSALGGLNNIFQAAFQGGGGIGGAIKSMATNMTSGLLSMIPMVGPFLSQFSGAIVAGLSKLGGLFGIGPSQGRKDLLAANADIKKLQDELLKTYGSLDKIREMGGAAGQALADAWGSQGAAGLEHLKGLADEFAAKLKQDTADQAAADKAAADAKVQYSKDQQDLADAIKTKQDMLTAAVERYKFTLEELGPAMKNQKLSEQAEQLLNDFSMLVGSGINVDTVLKRMGGSINDFVKNALKTGTEVPEAMRPMLEAMIKQGTLTDANGRKITDLKTSGISFGETLTQGFSRVVLKLDELIQRLTGKLAPALDTTVPDAAAKMEANIKQNAEAAGRSIEDNLTANLIGDGGVTDAIEEVSRAFGDIADQLPDSITIPIHFDVDEVDLPGGEGAGGGGGGGGDSDGPQWSAARRARFVENNGETDIGRWDGWMHGTGGRYLDFGAGTPTTLHGRERVMTEAEGRTEAARMAGLTEEFRTLRSEMARDRRDFPRAIAVAVQSAIVLAR